MSGTRRGQEPTNLPTGLPTLDRRWVRYVLFSCIYLYQGLIAGFSLTALANHYAGIGIPASEVGLHFAVAGLPWTIQPILWGPLIDRAGDARMGRRRVWAMVAVLGAQLSLCLLWLVPGPAALAWVGLVFLMHSVFASLLDTVCDRMIMDHVPDGELGRMSGCTRGGFVIGTSLGSALFAPLLSTACFQSCVTLLIVIGTLTLVPVLLVRESTADALLSLAYRAGDRRRTRSYPSTLGRFFIGLRHPATLRLLGLCFVLDFALSLFEVRFNVEVVQVHGWDAAALSGLQAGLAVASGTVGALTIGLWSDRAGPLPALTGLLVGGAATFLLAALLIGAGLMATSAPLILALTGVLPSLLIVAMVPALMRASRGRPGAATRFEAFMATMNLGAVSGGGVSGLVAWILPSSGVAVLVGAIFLVAAAASRRTTLLDFGRARAGRESVRTHV